MSQIFRRLSPTLLLICLVGSSGFGPAAHAAPAASPGLASVPDVTRSGPLVLAPKSSSPGVLRAAQTLVRTIRAESSELRISGQIVAIRGIGLTRAKGVGLLWRSQSEAAERGRRRLGAYAFVGASATVVAGKLYAGSDLGLWGTEVSAGPFAAGSPVTGTQVSIPGGIVSLSGSTKGGIGFSFNAIPIPGRAFPWSRAKVSINVAHPALIPLGYKVVRLHERMGRRLAPVMTKLRPVTKRADKVIAVARTAQDKVLAVRQEVTQRVSPKAARLKQKGMATKARSAQSLTQLQTGVRTRLARR